MNAPCQTECKADNITIKAADYAQGEAYAL